MPKLCLLVTFFAFWNPFTICYANDYSVSKNSTAIVITGGLMPGESDPSDLKKAVFRETSQAAKSAFRKLNYNKIVHLLNPTQEDLVNVLENINDQAVQQEVAIYFIGHGLPHPENSPNGVDSKIHLSTSFVIHKAPDQYDTMAYSFSYAPNWISGAELNRLLLKFIDPKAKLLLIFHTCYSGGLANSLKGINREIILASNKNAILDGYYDFEYTKFIPENEELSKLDAQLFKGTALFSSVLFNGLTCEKNAACFRLFDENRDGIVDLNEILDFAVANIRGHFWSVRVRKNLLLKWVPMNGEHWVQSPIYTDVDPVYWKAP